MESCKEAKSWEKDMEKKKMKSIERLRDAEYARTLAELGYDVPEEFL